MDASSFAADREQRFNEVVAAYLEAVESGRPADREALLRSHPDLAAELSAFFAEQEAFGAWAAPVREVIRDVAGGASTAPEPLVAVAERPGAESSAGLPSFGDYEVLAELGQGGMGVVYRARQKSLNRPVALKVLRAVALASPEDRRRFRNEAETVALLDHPNIVPVYEVGEHEGRLYFSMKLVEGGSLAGQLDRFRDDQPAAARLLIAVARAVHHAHQRGVLHRDLKPSNIVLDWRAGGVSPLSSLAGSPPVPHVTDFGLARRVATDSSLTASGALVGTPRYMAPEQASGRKELVTTATDVYGLGAVLYALLTGGPPFEAEGVQETLEQVRTCEPRPPSALRRGVDRELETVCLKCLEKEPARRYASAAELADDLERWLNHEPVQARRTPWWRRLGKWARRRPAAAAFTALLLLTCLAAGGAGLWWVQRRAEAQADVRASLEEATRLCEGERWAEGLRAVRRVQPALAGAGADRAFQQQADELARDLEMGRRLEEARLQLTAVKNEHFDAEGADRAFAEAFRWYGLELEQLDPQAAAQWIQGRLIAPELVAAVIAWANVRPSADPGARRLLATARAAVPEDLRLRLRQAVARKDPRAVQELISSAPHRKLPVATVVLLGEAFDIAVPPESRATFLRQAQSASPTDFWVNQALAVALEQCRPPRRQQAIQFYTAAVAIRPDSPGARLNLGCALADNGQFDEAIAEYRAALLLKKDYANAHDSLGTALARNGHLDEGIAEIRVAIDLKKDQANFHANLANALTRKARLADAQTKKRLLDEAVAECREAIRLKKDFAGACFVLGWVLEAKGQPDAAIKEYSTALVLDPRNTQVRAKLCALLLAKERWDELLAVYQEAIKLEPKEGGYHLNVGAILCDVKHDYENAAYHFRRTIELVPRDARAYSNLGNVLRHQGRLDEAIAYYQKATLLKWDNPIPHDNLGSALADKGRFDEAIFQYRTVVALRPNDAMAHYKLAGALLQNRQPEQAIAEYKAFFAAAPARAGDLNMEPRYDAACAAALAGCGHGRDQPRPDENQRQAWRKQALDWLRADLAAYAQLVGGPAQARAAVAQRLEHWRQDPDLASIRGEAALAKLPEAEREGWRKLWGEVEQLLDRLRAGQKKAGKAGTKRPAGAGRQGGA